MVEEHKVEEMVLLILVVVEVEQVVVRRVMEEVVSLYLVIQVIKLFRLLVEHLVLLENKQLVQENM